MLMQATSVTFTYWLSHWATHQASFPFPSLAPPFRENLLLPACFLILFAELSMLRYSQSFESTAVNFYLLIRGRSRTI